MTAYRNLRGFTLFELLVAVSILAVISAMAYTGLIQVENSRVQLETKQDRLTQLQLAILHIERDVQQVVHRPIHDQYGSERPSVAGGNTEFLLELTRGGVPNPAHVTRSSLQRVAYIVEGNNLERLYWLVLDQAQDSLPVKQVLLKNISSVEFQFLDPAGNWDNSWPPPSTALAGTPLSDKFPRAISVKLVLPDMGTIRRLFVLPEA